MKELIRILADASSEVVWFDVGRPPVQTIQSLEVGLLLILVQVYWTDDDFRPKLLIFLFNHKLIKLMLIETLVLCAEVQRGQKFGSFKILNRPDLVRTQVNPPRSAG